MWGAISGPHTMTAGALVLVLAAAVLHSGWNALAKRGADPLAFLALCSCVAAPILLPVAAPLLWRDGVPAQARQFVLGTIALHVLYFYALGRAYSSGAYSIVYPIARGLGVALVPIGAYLLLDERLSPIGIAGIAFVVLGVTALHQVGHRYAVATGATLGAATLWAVITGLSIGAYSLNDKAGVAHVHPVAYMLLMEACCGLVLLPAALVTRPSAVRREWETNWRAILAVGAMSAAGYTLVLLAFRLSKAGYVVAARELSIVLSALIGTLWMGEGRVGPRLAAASIVLAGVACVALAR
jgi:drug/metabolite transporter (DMT)-like permease